MEAYMHGVFEVAKKYDKLYLFFFFIDIFFTHFCLNCNLIIVNIVFLQSGLYAFNFIFLFRFSECPTL